MKELKSNPYLEMEDLFRKQISEIVSTTESFHFGHLEELQDRINALRAVLTMKFKESSKDQKFYDKRIISKLTQTLEDEAGSEHNEV